MVLGVDTHLHSHVAVALDRLGRKLGALAVPATAKGYEALVSWAEGFGDVSCAGVEGTGSFGAGLSRRLRAEGIEVPEVERPERRHLRRRGKSDPIDAEARAVLAGEAAGTPKSGDGRVEMARAIRAARRSAVKAKTQAANQLGALRVTAPEGLRHRLSGLSTGALVAAAARFGPGAWPENPEEATKFAMRSVARRYRALSEEIAELGAQLGRLVSDVAPGLISLVAVGTDTLPRKWPILQQAGAFWGLGGSVPLAGQKSVLVGSECPWLLELLAGTPPLHRPHRARRVPMATVGSLIPRGLRRLTKRSCRR